MSFFRSPQALAEKFLAKTEISSSFVFSYEDISLKNS